jgi:tetratricopeptide (TPR) repeat protein
MLALLVAHGSEARAQANDELDALQRQVADLHAARKLEEAAQVGERYVATAKRLHGENHQEYAISLNWLALVYRDQNRLSEAGALYRKAVEIGERGGPEALPNLGIYLDGLGRLYMRQRRYGDAERTLKRALAVTEEAYHEQHVDLSYTLAALADLYKQQGRTEEAGPLLRRAHAIREKSLGSNHLDTISSLVDLAEHYEVQGRSGEAETLLLRAITTLEKNYGPDHPRLGRALNNLAGVYTNLARDLEAVPLLRRAIAIVEKAYGPEHPEVATALDNLAVVYKWLERYDEAEPLYKRALAIREKALSGDHPDLATSLNNLARSYQAQGRYSEARPLFERSRAILTKAFGPDHQLVATSLNNLADNYYAEGNWEKAHELFGAAGDIVLKRDTRSATPTGPGGFELHSNQIVQAQIQRAFAGLVWAGWHLAQQRAERRAEIESQAFQAAQRSVQTSAAAALLQMAARQAKGEGELAGLVRRRQDLTSEWQRRDKDLVAALSGAAEGKPEASEQARLERVRLAEVDRTIIDIDSRLRREFPEYYALSSPEPLTVSETQKLLRPDEALLHFLMSDRDGFAWLISKTSVRWVHLNFAASNLAEKVQTLRCGLDRMQWTSTGQDPDRPLRCLKLTGVARAPRADAPLPFRLDVAHDLYRALFGQFDDLVKGKHLVLVLTGSLSSLPLQVLVTAPPKAPFATKLDDYRSVAWLGAAQPISVLPSVSSLKALRTFAKTGKAPEPYIGFGDPVLTGHEKCPAVVVPSVCPGTQVAGAVGRAKEAFARIAGVTLKSVSQVFRGGLADVEAVRTLCPLPDTAHELKCVARSVGAAEDRVHIRAAATETAVKKEQLDRYRIIHFATHGLLAGETEKIANAGAEPALVLTPPARPSEEDDGLLTASEIAGLKLNADWVIMSACNTAAGGQGAETLSGLARAFFYAGARALLVSHWEVYSDAAVKLTTAAFMEMQKHERTGRAEAMRRSMAALMAEGGFSAHPASWAPFIVVGEGAR